MLRLLRADQQVRFGEIDRKVSSIDGNMSESQMRLSKIDEKTAEFQKRLEARIASDSAANNSRIAEINKLLQIAMSDFNAGRYEIATSGFNDLISRFPDASQAQEALYWVAECFYARKLFPDAEKTYIQYVKQFPTGEKVCVSLYKLGMSYEKQQKTKSRDVVWKKLAEQCPDSQEMQVIKSNPGR